jgi:hypothetical protein
MVAYSPAHCRGNGNPVPASKSSSRIPRVTVRRPGARLLCLFLTFILACAVPVLAKADPFKAAVTTDVSGGYARLVFALGDDVDASAHSAGNVLIVSFDKPVLISIDRLSAQASEYIGAARRDPDGRAIRIALARKVTVNSIAAGDKFFVDLLPDTWSGPPPSLPQDVVEELARRAREAERLERLAHQAAQKKSSRRCPCMWRSSRPLHASCSTFRIRRRCPQIAARIG